MDQTAVVLVEVRVPQRYAGEFLRQMSGDDEDVILAAEKAVREKIRTDYPTSSDDIELAIRDEDDTREELRRHAEAERRERVTYGPYADEA